MRATCVLFFALAGSLALRADFSYSTTVKGSGGMMGAAPANNRATKTYLKGQKMKIDNGSTSSIIDFGAQTITHLDTVQKTYSVSKLNDIADDVARSGADINITVKDTGEHKKINGYDASEVILSMDLDTPQSQQAGMKMHMDMEMWISSDVPGSGELRAFYQRNAGKFPWAALAGDGGRGNPSVKKAMADLMRKMADMKGVPVMQVIKMGGGNEAQTAAMQKGMAQAKAQLEEMKRQGKLPPQMEETLKRMNAGSAGGSLFETTTESSDFSASAIPDSVFAIPAGYQQSQR